MRKLVTVLATGLIVLSIPAGAYSQETVTTAGVEARRVVIAPPQSELARSIKAGLSASYQDADPESSAYQDMQKLYFFYGARHFEPLWLSEGADGTPAFSPTARKLIDVFKAAEAEGFRPSDYLTPDLDLDATGGNPLKLAAVEIAFSASVIRYAQNAIGGRIDPREVSTLWTIQPRRINGVDLLTQLAVSDDPAVILDSLHPKHKEFLALRAALSSFTDEIVEEQISIADGPLLKPGMSDERVPLLRQRLNVSEDIPESAANATVDIKYDETLVRAVKAFQENLGLIVDGVIGPATVAALNGGTSTTRNDIIANMERWRWLPETLGDFHVVVNLPEFRLYVQQGTPARGYEVTYTTRVVIGTPKNQTPVFSDEIEHLVVNPYWNVPSSIARNEIGPLLAANPWYLDSQNMELLSGDSVINAAAVDWSSTPVNNFRIRQRPGTGNALGQIKFLFPNQHDVYLHDTPSKSLFERSYRAYSHGCVRVQDPMAFAAALLENESNLNIAMLENMVGGGERWNNLERHIPVHLTYFTLRVDPDGTIRSYADVYGHNERLTDLLDR